MPADYMTLGTVAQRLAGARAYYAELMAAGNKANVSDGGRSVDYGNVQSAIARVQSDIERLERQAAMQIQARGGWKTYARFRPY